MIYGSWQRYGHVTKGTGGTAHAHTHSAQNAALLNTHFLQFCLDPVTIDEVQTSVRPRHYLLYMAQSVEYTLCHHNDGRLFWTLCL